MTPKAWFTFMAGMALGVLATGVGFQLGEMSKPEDLASHHHEHVTFDIKHATLYVDEKHRWHLKAFDVAENGVKFELSVAEEPEVPADIRLEESGK